MHRKNHGDEDKKKTYRQKVHILHLFDPLFLWLDQRRGGCRRRADSNAASERKLCPWRKRRALKSQSLLRSTSKSLQWSQVYITPGSHPWHRPSFHPRRRGWNVMKVNCSQPPFAASVRRCPALLSSFQSLSLFSSQPVLSKSPFGCAKVCVCECPYACVCLKFLSHIVFWWPLAESFPDSGSVGLFDSCNLSRPGHGEIRQRNLIINLRLSLRQSYWSPPALLSDSF